MPNRDPLPIRRFNSGRSEDIVISSNFSSVAKCGCVEKGRNRFGEITSQVWPCDEHRWARTEPKCTCGYDATPTQHRFFCPWREWWLKERRVYA